VCGSGANVEWCTARMGRGRNRERWGVGRDVRRGELGWRKRELCGRRLGLPSSTPNARAASPARWPYVLASMRPDQALDAYLLTGVALKALFPRFKLTQTKVRLEEDHRASVGTSSAVMRR
jgi:hypothetical protein